MTKEPTYLDWDAIEAEIAENNRKSWDSVDHEAVKAKAAAERARAERPYLWDLWGDAFCGHWVGSNEQLAAYLISLYPGKHIEDFSDEVHVYDSADDLDSDDDVEPIAGGTCEGPATDEQVKERDEDAECYHLYKLDQRT
jgi:hypothetical protein